MNGGRTEHLTGQAPLAGDLYGQSFAVPLGLASVITIAAVTPGPDYLYRSANGGKTWVSITVPRTSGGILMTSLSDVSRSVGAVVVQLDQLLRTTDVGLSWHAVKF